MESILKHFMVWVTLTMLSLPLYAYLTIAAFPKIDETNDPLVPIQFFELSLYIFYFGRLLERLSSWILDPPEHPIENPSWLLNTFPILRKRIFEYLAVCSIPLPNSAIFLMYVCFFIRGCAVSAHVLLFTDHRAWKYYILPFTYFPLFLWSIIFLPGIPFTRKMGAFTNCGDARRCLLESSDSYNVNTRSRDLVLLLLLLPLLLSLLLRYDSLRSRAMAYSASCAIGRRRSNSFYINSSTAHPL